MRIVIDDINYVKHYGAKGMKWGVRKPTRRQVIAASLVAGSAFALKRLGQPINMTAGLIGTGTVLAIQSIVVERKDTKMSEITSG